MESIVNSDMLLEFKDQIKKEDLQELSYNIRKEGIRAAVLREQKNTDWLQCDIKLPEYCVSHQGKTGRCWIYAVLNMIRPAIIKEHQLKDILLSQNYIAFYDLLEKANYFLEIILNTLDEDTDSRLLSWKLLHPIQDAGQWFFFQNILEKYGIVPWEAMPDLKHSRDTSELIGVLSDMLRENACVIRSKYRKSVEIKDLRELKENMLYRIYRTLSLSLGEPPESFAVSLELTDGSVIREDYLTPMEFYRKYFHENYNEDYCTIVNIPSERKPFFENYKVSYQQNMAGAQAPPYLNLPMEIFKKLVQEQLKAGIPVWFGCDSRVYGDWENGIYALENYDLYELGFQHGPLDKEENLQYGISSMTHAMVLKGFSYNKEGGVDRWLAENSYGKEAGQKGYFAISDQWFELFVYEAVIHKQFLDSVIIKCCEKESIILPPWDVLGNLAK